MQANVDTLRVLEINRRFHDEVEAAHYDERMGVCHSPEAVQKTIAELERVLGEELPRGGWVADVGSGTGNIAIKLALDGRFDRVTAVDISSKSLEKLSDTAHSLHVLVETVVSEMQPLPFEDDSLDLLVGCAFLHHMPNPEQFMDEVARVLKPGARFVIIGEPTHLGATITNVVKFPLVAINRLRRLFVRENLFRWEHDQIDVHTFTQADVHNLFERRFDQTRVCCEGFLEPVVDQAILAPLRRFLPETGIAGRLFGSIQASCSAVDRALLNRTLPSNLKVSLKVSGICNGHHTGKVAHMNC